MKLFGRRKQQNVDPALPPELQAYSRSGRRERLGIVWLVGIVSVIISILVMTLLFFGGRWVYRKIAHRGNQATPVIVTDQRDANEKDTQTDRAQSDADSENSFDEDVDTEQTAPQTQPVTGDQSNDASALPRTGPELDL